MNIFIFRTTKYGLLVGLFLAVVLCGCFQATNKFYLDTDITTDKRFEGRFMPQATNQGDAAVTSLLVKLDVNNHYVATIQEGSNWIKLDVVLFKVGTNLFLDISHLADNGKLRSHNNTPSGLDVLKRVTQDKNHIAIRFQFVEDGIELHLALGVPFVRAIKNDQTLKLRAVDDHFAILLDSSEKLRLFLAKIGSDDAFFQQKTRWVRIVK